MNQTTLKYLLQPFILHYDDKVYAKSTPNNSHLSYITIISNVIIISEDNDKMLVSKTIESGGTGYFEPVGEEIETTKEFLFEDYYSAMKKMALVCASYKVPKKDIFSITCSLMETREYHEFLKDFYKNNPEIFI